MTGSEILDCSLWGASAPNLAASIGPFPLRGSGETYYGAILGRGPSPGMTSMGSGI